MGLSARQDGLLCTGKRLVYVGEDETDDAPVLSFAGPSDTDHLPTSQMAQRNTLCCQFSLLSGLHLLTCELIFSTYWLVLQQESSVIIYSAQKEKGRGSIRRQEGHRTHDRQGHHHTCARRKTHVTAQTDSPQRQ